LSKGINFFKNVFKKKIYINYNRKKNKNQKLKKLREGIVLIEEKKSEEICSNCGAKLSYYNYFYEHKVSISGYQCSKCGFFEFYDFE